MTESKKTWTPRKAYIPTPIRATGRYHTEALSYNIPNKGSTHLLHAVGDVSLVLYDAQFSVQPSHASFLVLGARRQQGKLTQTQLGLKTINLYIKPCTVSLTFFAYLLPSYKLFFFPSQLL